jgi:hypothetical protein
MALKKYKNFYTGKNEWLTEEENRKGIEGRQAISEALKLLLDHPKHSLIAAWYLFAFIAILMPAAIITGDVKNDEILGAIGSSIFFLIILWLWIRASRKKLEKMKEEDRGSPLVELIRVLFYVPLKEYFKKKQ